MNLLYFSNKCIYLGGLCISSNLLILIGAHTWYIFEKINYVIFMCTMSIINDHNMLSFIQGMKIACTHYQSAAGAFTYIKACAEGV